MAYITKDSGERQEFDSGMRRDIQSGKARYDLVHKPGLKRVAELMARGAEKYGERNWELAKTQEELDRFKASANRHFEQWMAGEGDEDHMAAVVFNLFAAEMVKEKLRLADKQEFMAQLAKISFEEPDKESSPLKESLEEIGNEVKQSPSTPMHTFVACRWPKCADSESHCHWCGQKHD